MQPFSATQLNRLAARGAKLRQATIPMKIMFREMTINVICSGFQEAHQLAEGGFQESMQATLRILRTLLDSRPVLDETFVVVETGLQYRIVGVTDNPRSPEWLLTVGPVDN